jgi:glycosyltransferase involved in cell wall biosynthesis
VKTLVEASAAFDQGAGIGRYARNILTRLIEASDDEEWVLVRAPAERAAASYFDPARSNRVKVVTLPFSRRNADRLWFRMRVPVDIRLFGGRGDVVYSPDFTAPPMPGVRRMITVHDLAFVTHPCHTTEALRRYLEGAVPREVARADKVAVVSQATRKDVVRLLGVPEDKVVVVANGVDDRFYQAAPLDGAARKRLRLPEHYLLMVGTIEPRKNHLNAMRALERSRVGEHLPLVIAGRPGWGHERTMEEARRLVDRGLVHLLDYFPDEDLPGLYAGAKAVLYPSWTEGFGLPVVEALASGTPVMTGTAPALREVGGDEAVYVDPGDVEGLADRIRHVAELESSDADRARRQEWTRRFSWDTSTSTVIESLKTLSRR